MACRTCCSNSIAAPSAASQSPAGAADVGPLGAVRLRHISETPTIPSRSTCSIANLADKSLRYRNHFALVFASFARSRCAAITTSSGLISRIVAMAKQTSSSNMQSPRRYRLTVARLIPRTFDAIVVRPEAQLILDGVEIFNSRWHGDFPEAGWPKNYRTGSVIVFSDAHVIFFSPIRARDWWRSLHDAGSRP